MTPIFRQAHGSSGVRARIAISDGQNTSTFENLFIADVQVVNRGNSGIERFPFGVILAGGDKCVHVERLPPDRHHLIIQETEVTPQDPQSEIDFILDPFNRKDSYLVKLYIVIPEGSTDPQAIELGSSHPIKFVEMPTVAETLSKAVSGVSLSVGDIDFTASLKPTVKRHIPDRSLF